jgi:Icc protein
LKDKQASPLRVIQLSDTHIQSKQGGQLWKVDVDANLIAVIQRLKTHHWPADLILVTGDLVQDEGAAAYRRFYEFLAPLEVPVYCLPGNHDDPVILRQTLVDDLVCQKRHIVAGNWQFILLNSTLKDSSSGYLAASELLFLDSTLSAYSHQHTMVCLHHQPVAIGSTWLDTMTVSNSAEFFAIVDKHSNVKAVIWGHIHQAFARQRRGIALLSAPSTCVQFQPGQATPKADTLTPGYRWFELKEDGHFSSGVERISAIIEANKSPHKII